MVGLTGTFTAVTLVNPSPTIDQSQIAFAEDNRLFLMDADGSNLRQIVGTRPTPITRISFSAGGGNIYFSDFGGLWQTSSIGNTPVLVEGGGSNASVSPDGTKILYQTANGLFISNINGTGDTKIPGSDLWSQGWWYDNQRVSIRSGNQSRLTNISDGTSNTLFIAEDDFVGGGRFGSNYITSYFDGTTKLRRYSLPLIPNGNWTQRSFSMPSDFINMLAISPDGMEVVTAEYNNQNPSGASYIRRRSMLDFSVVQTLRTRVGDFSAIQAVAWQPFVTNRVIAGAASLFGGDAHGVVFGRSAERPGAVVLARANTPASVRIAAEGGAANTGPHVIYTIEADRFTKLSYSLDRNFSLYNLPLTATTNGAFATFSSQTGRIVDVITYSVTRGAGKPKLTREGNARIYEGAIQGVYDANGKNLAPSGASRVRVDGFGRVEIR